MKLLCLLSTLMIDWSPSPRTEEVSLHSELYSCMSLKSQIPSLIFLIFLQETGNRAEHVVKIKLESMAILQKNSYDEDPAKWVRMINSVKMKAALTTGDLATFNASIIST